MCGIKCRIIIAWSASLKEVISSNFTCSILCAIAYVKDAIVGYSLPQQQINKRDWISSKLFSKLLRRNLDVSVITNVCTAVNSSVFCFIFMVSFNGFDYCILLILSICLKLNEDYRLNFPKAFDILANSTSDSFNKLRTSSASKDLTVQYIHLLHSNEVNLRYPTEGLRNCAKKKNMWNEEVLHEEIPQANEAANGSNVTRSTSTCLLLEHSHSRGSC